MRYKFFSNSEKAWEAMFEAIKSAKESVYIEMYIFMDDMSDFNFIKLLQEKAKNGVRVRIVLDSFGSGDLKIETINNLKEAGVEVLFFSHFLHHTHRKVLVVDEKTSFIGGVNFHQSTFYWKDLVIGVKGKILLRHIVRSFAKVYADCGGKDILILQKDKKIIFRKMNSWLVEHFPISRKFSLKKLYRDHLGQAQKNIILITPYFMPKRWLIGLLHQAVLRGVKVEVLVPKDTDYLIIDRVNYFFMFKLAKLGVNFYVEPEMNHAKVMIIDLKEGLVGSNNLDFLSFEFNSEVGVFLKDLNAVRKLSEIAEEWKKEATFFDFRTYKPKFWDYVFSPFIRLFFLVW